MDSYPPWAKQLVGNFEPGKTLLTFRARTPASSEVAVCRFAVNVRGKCIYINLTLILNPVLCTSTIFSYGTINGVTMSYFI